MLDEKLIKELTTSVNSRQWDAFLKYVKVKKEEVVISLVSTSGEDTYKAIGKLKVYDELLNFRDTINSLNKGQNNG